MRFIESIYLLFIDVNIYARLFFVIYNIEKSTEKREDFLLFIDLRIYAHLFYVIYNTEKSTEKREDGGYI